MAALSGACHHQSAFPQPHPQALDPSCFVHLDDSGLWGTSRRFKSSAQGDDAGKLLSERIELPTVSGCPWLKSQMASDA